MIGQGRTAPESTGRWRRQGSTGEEALEQEHAAGSWVVLLTFLRTSRSHDSFALQHLCIRPWMEASRRDRIFSTRGGWWTTSVRLAKSCSPHRSQQGRNETKIYHSWMIHLFEPRSHINTQRGKGSTSWLRTEGDPEEHRQASFTFRRTLSGRQPKNSLLYKPSAKQYPQ